jgi:hypothetical protein
MAGRERNPRVVAREHIMHMWRRIDWLKAVTRVRGVISDPDTARGYRKRRPEEYPENQPQFWRDVAEQARVLSAEAATLAEYAAAQLRRLTEQEAS